MLLWLCIFCSTWLAHTQRSMCSEKCCKKNSFVFWGCNLYCLYDLNKTLFLCLLFPFFILWSLSQSAVETFSAVKNPDLALYISSAKFCCHLYLEEWAVLKKNYKKNNLLSFSNHSNQDRWWNQRCSSLAGIFSHVMQSNIWNFLLHSVGSSKCFWKVRVKLF